MSVQTVKPAKPAVDDLIGLIITSDCTPLTSSHASESILDQEIDEVIALQSTLEPLILNLLAPFTSVVSPSAFNVNLARLPEHMKFLARLITPEATLRAIYGWTREPPTDALLKIKTPCYNCGSQMVRVQGGICKYHFGMVNSEERFTCCNRLKSLPGCKTASEHAAFVNWSETMKFETTGDLDALDPRKVVVIDCEMGRSRANRNELIRLTMIDYITEEVLIDSLVFPGAQMVDYNSKYSGVTQANMREAVRTGLFINGVAEARARVFQYVDRRTIVIGHALNNDFNAMHWIHNTVVDTLLIERRFQEQNPGYRVNIAERYRLATLAQVRLGRNIRANGVHDSKEDCHATGDLVKWHVKNNTKIV